MCGICGIIEKHSEPSKKLLKQMCDVIAHRGPDDEGIFINNNVGLGHRRLSILDLSDAGHQPFLSDDKNKILVFNGEIYNFLELKKNLESENIRFKSSSDTEVLLKMYEKYGTDCLKFFRGMFAFAIYDFTDNSLFAARDRTGQKPFFYTFQDGIFRFASEIKSILQDSRFRKNPDLTAIHHYLSLKYVPHPYSAFEDIHKLPQAHYLILKDNKITIKKYWNINFSNEKISDVEQIKSELKSLFFESVKLRMISDVPLGAFLSGGIDSSIIVSIMSELSNQSIKTFSIGFDIERFDESAFAQEIADKYKTEHRCFNVKSDLINDIDKLVWHYNEPFADPSMLPTYYLSKETRKYVTVALSGDAGDENFAGYLRYLGYLIGSKTEIIPKKIRDLVFGTLYRSIPPSSRQQTKYNKFYRLVEILASDGISRYMPMIEDFTDKRKKNIYTDNFYNKISLNKSENILSEYFNRVNTEFELDKLLYTDLNTYLPDDILTKVDVASMAVSLECRSPFLDHNIIEYAAKIHPSLKINGRITKHILKETFKDYIPDNLRNREKMGFTVPISEWFRKDLKSYVKNIFSDKFYDRGLFRKNEIEKIINLHLSGREEHGYRLWNLLCLELWFRKFID